MKPDKVPPQLLVIGGSAGSLHVIIGLVSYLRADFPLAVLIVLHRNGLFESSLEELLSSRTSLTVKEVEEKESIIPGTLYLCPADYHVLLEKTHTFSLDYSERVHYSRPSIDVSFRSAADVFGPSLISLLLSGGNTDGTEGLQYIQEKGGITIVQDPATADVPYMPQYAISSMEADFITPAEQIPRLIDQLARQAG
jgi:two-component system, chemotaxis family, protein-glutamate methylesterase/glutaminase